MPRLLDLFQKAFDAYQSTQDYTPSLLSFSGSKIEKLKSILKQHLENKDLTDNKLATDILALRNDKDLMVVGHKSKDLLDVLIHAINIQQHKAASASQLFTASMEANKAVSALGAAYVPGNFDSYAPKFKAFVSVAQDFISEITAAQMKQLEKDLETRHAQQLAEQLEQQLAAVNALKAQNEDAQKKLKLQAEEHDRFKTNKSEQSSEQEERIEALNTKIDEIKRELLAAYSDAEHQRKLITQHANAKQVAEAGASHLQEQISEKSRVLSEEHLKLLDAQKTIKEMQIDFSEILDRIQLLATELKISEAEIQRLSLANTTLSAELVTAEYNLQTSETIRASVEAIKDSLEVQLKDGALEDQIEDDRHLETVRENRSLSLDILALKRKIEELRARCQMLEQTNEHVFENAHDEMSQKVDEMEAVKLQLEDQIRELSLEAAESATAVEATAEELQVARSKIETLKDTSRLLNQYNDDLNAENNGLRAALEVAGDELADLKTNHTHLIQELEVATILMSKTDQELRSTKETLEQVLMEDDEQQPLLSSVATNRYAFHRSSSSSSLSRQASPSPEDRNDYVLVNIDGYQAPENQRRRV